MLLQQADAATPYNEYKQVSCEFSDRNTTNSAMYFHHHIMDLLLSAFVKNNFKQYPVYVYICISMMLSLCYTPKCALKQGDENPARIIFPTKPNQGIILPVFSRRKQGQQTKPM